MANPTDITKKQALGKENENKPMEAGKKTTGVGKKRSKGKIKTPLQKMKGKNEAGE